MIAHTDFAHRSLAVLVLGGALLLSAAAEAKVEGTFHSPVGLLQLKDSEGIITGRVIGKSPCKFKKGKVVFNGTRLDDTVTGALTVCRQGPGCEGTVDAIAMLLVSPRGTGLSGAVHVEAGKCKTPLKGEELRMRRYKKKPKKPKKPKQPKDGKTGDGKGDTSSGDDDNGSDYAPSTPQARAKAEAKAQEAHKLLGAGDAEGARRLFQEAVKIDDGFSEGFVGLGITYYLRDRYDEAERYYKEALDRMPTNPDAFYNIACLYALRGEKEKALGFLRLAVANGYVKLSTLSSDPDLKGLEGDEGFENLKQGILQ